MYPISKLVYSTFWQDKKARHKYLSLFETRRPERLLNNLARQIERGEIDQRLKYALLEAGVPVIDVAHALEETSARKRRAEFERHKPGLTADFNTVPKERRKLNVGYIMIGAVTVVPLPRDIAHSPWNEQLGLVSQRIQEHRTDFYSERMRSSRQNYFGEVSGYVYKPAFNLSFYFSSEGKLER